MSFRRKFSRRRRGYMPKRAKHAKRIRRYGVSRGGIRL